MPVDRKRIIDEFSKIKVRGNSEGLIPAMGVLVQFLPAGFWNNFTEKMLKSAGQYYYSSVEKELLNAAHECGYYTGYGIITSNEFKAIVEPMLDKSKSSLLHGVFAVLTAWGWANAEIIELDSEERMVVRAYNYYEAEIKDTFIVKKPCAYMLRGVSAAFMDLAYGTPYPNGMNTYKCEQTKGIELGDSCGEFVVTKV